MPEAGIDEKRKREELKARRNLLFRIYLKNSGIRTRKCACTILNKPLQLFGCEAYKPPDADRVQLAFANVGPDRPRADR
jgi:hypothetical protein